MAHVRERNGIYTIIEYLGRDSNGKRHDYSETFKPAPGMGKREIKKELNKRIAAVEEKCRTGLISDSDITLSEFIDQWFNDYGEKRL